MLHGSGEYYDPNWMDSNTVVLPPKEPWDYGRELDISDINIWEQICAPWDLAVFAAWDPHAEFYVVRFEDNYNYDGSKSADEKRQFRFETYYGKGAQEQVYNRLKEVGLTLPLNDVWVDPDKMWLYS